MPWLTLNQTRHDTLCPGSASKAERLRPLDSYHTNPQVVCDTGGKHVNLKWWCGHLRHKRTLRGHLHAAYMVAVDPLGKYLVTGSDDCVAKIWCSRTGVLQASCCGHLVRPCALSLLCYARGSTGTCPTQWYVSSDARRGGVVDVPMWNSLRHIGAVSVLRQK
jgi:WD40 repeat protein